MSILHETVIPFSQLPAFIERKVGKRVSISTPHRWRQMGVRGVKLESLKVAGERFTSVEAVERFLIASSEQQMPSPAGISDGNAMPGGRSYEPIGGQDDIEAEFEREGI